MQKIKKGYKVVREINGKYCSCMKGILLFKGTKIYKVGEFVKPQRGFGPLSVFTKLNKAKTFRKFNGDNKKYKMKIFKCEFIESEKTYLYGRITGGVYYSRTGFKLPINTHFADAVKLIEEVKI